MLIDRPDPYYEPTEATCTSCEQDCMAVEVDMGIGPYEFWGCKGFHHDYRIVSNCCEAAVTDSDDTERTD